MNDHLKSQPRLSYIILCVLVLAAGGWSQTETVLHSFGATGDGAMPLSGLIADAQGNLYGTTSMGGTINDNCGSGCGTVFQLMPNANGGWTENILYEFQGGYPGMGLDGGYPQGPLALSPGGQLYGWTGCTPFDCDENVGGIIFHLVPQTGGGWSEQIFYYLTNEFDFGGGCTGAMCWVDFDHGGHIFAAVPAGGTHGGGVIDSFIAPFPRGQFVSAVHEFNVGSNDGYGAYTNLVFDAGNNMYGTTRTGGIENNGAVFEFSPGAGGQWTETLLHSFAASMYLPSLDGGYPIYGVVIGPDGNLYGTTYSGGLAAAGTAFKLVPNGDGTWTESVIRSFGGQQGDHPGPLTVDAAGNLYGVAAGGGGCGTVFKLSPAPGQWTLQVLHLFSCGMDGEDPVGPVVVDSNGNVFGATTYGGEYGQGVAFEISP